MNFKLNNALSNEINALIIGIPEHLSQLERVSFNHIDITESLERLEHQHIIGGKVGKIYTTTSDVQNRTYRLITVNLENLKTRSCQDILKIWGHLFQYMKSEHTEDTYLPMDSFISRYDQLSDVLVAYNIQNERATYEFDHYKSSRKAPFKTNLNLISESLIGLDFIHEDISIGQSIDLVKDFSNMLPNVLAPQTFAEDIVSHFKSTKVKIDIKGYDTLVSEGFGLLQAVGKGSEHKPRLVTITYSGRDEDEAPTVLVGKDITYDPGGYSIKTRNGIATMRFDMYGTAGVVGIIEVANHLQLPVNIVGALVCAGNMMNEASMKPSDVFTALNGETVGVTNTDAEGRLILTDAVFYTNQYQPGMIMDSATLTGAAIVTLDDDKAAAFESNSRVILNDILQIGSEVDEMVFELPITAAERASIKHSDIADLVNRTNGRGKALFTASFVTHFSGQTPYIHFDTAGPATTSKASYNDPKEPTGFMIPTMAQ